MTNFDESISVGELIGRLSKYPANTRVFIPLGFDGKLGAINDESFHYLKDGYISTDSKILAILADDIQPIKRGQNEIF